MGIYISLRLYKVLRGLKRLSYRQIFPCLSHLELHNINSNNALNHIIHNRYILLIITSKLFSLWKDMSYFYFLSLVSIIIMLFYYILLNAILSYIISWICVEEVHLLTTDNGKISKHVLKHQHHCC